jgi:hypothetical protein
LVATNHPPSIPVTVLISSREEERVKPHFSNCDTKLLQSLASSVVHKASTKCSRSHWSSSDTLEIAAQRSIGVSVRSSSIRAKSFFRSAASLSVGQIAISQEVFALASAAPSGPTHPWAGSRPQRAGRSSMSEAPLPARSPYLKPWTMKRSDSRNKRGTRGAQVSRFRPLQFQQIKYK